MVYTKELSEAAVEVLAMLENCSDEILSKIPKNFTNYLIEIQSFDYEFNYDKNKRIQEQKFSDTALRLIGLIYKDYLCEDKEEYIKKLSKTKEEIEKEINEKYSYDNLFMKKEQAEQVSKELVVVENKENVFKWIVNKIKKIFYKNWRDG